MSEEASYGQRVMEASLEGFPLVLQGIGTITKNLNAYGAGVAVNGVVGIKQITDEVQRYAKIYWHPDQIHPKPNYYKAGSGIVNVAGAVVYGASSAGVLSPALGGAGAIVQGISYYAAKLLPQDAGTYYPPLPKHHPHGRAPRAPLHQEAHRPAPASHDHRAGHVEAMSSHGPPGRTGPTPALAVPGNAVMAGAAAVRPAGHETREPGESTRRAIESSAGHRPNVRAEVRGSVPRRSR